MTTILPKISLYADDISTSDFASFINEHYSNQSIDTVVSTHHKKGRDGFGEFIKVVASNEIVVGIFVNMLYDLLKFGFFKLKKILDSEPFAVITMQNGMEIRIPMTLSNEEIRLEIIQCLSKGDIESIEFDC